MSSNQYYLVDFDPPGLRVAVRAGTNLLEAARRAGVQIWSSCGGQASCGQCDVVVVEGWVSEITENELENLTVAELQSHHRLACSARIYSSVKVQVPEKSYQKPRSNNML